MTHNAKDIGRSLEGHKYPRVTKAKELRTRVSLAYALHETGLGLNAFAKKYLSHHEGRSGLVYKWIQGRSLTNRSVMRLDSRIPGIAGVHGLPLYELLEDRPISLARVKRLLDVYRGRSSSFIPWIFPNDDELKVQGRYVPVSVRQDSSRLFMRGDIYGFTAIVGLVREAEAKGNSEEHLLYCADMYRALPAVARIPWIAPHLDLLSACVQDVHARSLFSLMMLGVNWDIIRRQVEAPVHETMRERRPKHPLTGRFIDLEDPVVIRQLRDPQAGYV